MNQFNGNNNFQLGNVGPYQKPPYPKTNPGVAQVSPVCQKSPNCPPQSQADDTNAWLLDANHLSHTFTNEPLSTDTMEPIGRHGSPLISPKTCPQQQPSTAAQEESRKMPRAIGTERASWKHINFNEPMDKPESQHSGLPSWLLEKNHLQQAQQLMHPYTPQMAQTWMPFPDAHKFPDEAHFQEQYQVRVFYHFIIPHNILRK